jgi:hypothetical protein
VEKGKQEKAITVPEENGEYRVYVIVFKDGEVSGPLIINATTGWEEVEWIWGDEVPHLGLYVKSTGDDSNTGDKAHPLATVQKALQNLKTLYDADDDWPGKGTDEESAGAIIILDSVTVTQQIAIDGAVGYPPIVLCNDPAAGEGDPQGRLSGTRLLGLSNNADVTLSGGLILRRDYLINDNTGGYM